MRTPLHNMMRRIINALFIGFLLIFLNVSVPSVSAEGPAYHVVKPSETLWALAIRYGVSTDTLLRANGLSNPNWIYAGQVLVIPRTPEGPEYHVVLPGETVWSIAAQHGVSTWGIVYTNSLNPDLIYAGQTLVIPRGDKCCSGVSEATANPQRTAPGSVSSNKILRTGLSYEGSGKKMITQKPYAGGSLGFDISYPQCRRALPSAPHSFIIVGINGGKAFRANNCFAAQYDWAAKTSGSPPSIYMNLNYVVGSTADNGLDGPAGRCGRANEACKAYNYGFNAAKYSFEYAGARTAKIWWLDIELSNSWSPNTQMNGRVIQGAVDFFQNRGVIVGIYSAPNHWSKIAGTYKPKLVNQSVFPIWVFGPDNRKEAPDFCSPENAFGGGTIWLIQYPSGDFDGLYACG